MPDKLTDNEIKKALECCKIKRTCRSCSFNKGDEDSTCIKELMQETYTLINRLQAEKQDLEIELKAMRGAANSYKAENEELKSAINGFRGYEDKIKAEAYKEFAERVKLEFYYEFDELIPSIMADRIDNLLKELTEKSN